MVTSKIRSLYRDKSKLQSEPFNFKNLLDFTSFFKDPVRLGNRTYRAWR